jgi:putative flippase GtrA
MVRFGLVGGLNTLVDFVVFAALHVGLGTPLVLANVLAWLVAMTNSYVLNTRFTFKEPGREKPLVDLKRGLRFFGVSVGALLVASGLLIALAEIMPALTAKAVLIVVMPVLSFAAYRLIVYRP